MANTHTSFPSDLASLRPSWLRRSSDEALLTGVSAGLARRIDTHPLVVRVAFVLATLAVGSGLIIYLALWALARQVEATETRPLARELAWQSTFGVALCAVGVIIAAQSQGLWLGSAVTVPLVLAALGSVVLWSRVEPVAEQPSARRAWTIIERGSSPWRLVAGLLIIVGGIASFIIGNVTLATVGSVVITLIAVAAALTLLLGPFVVRLVQSNQAANRERIRSDERAEVSAHLHDSVLHTLALIQRSHDASPEVVSLARSQERDLRSWLQGRSVSEARTVKEAVDELASSVEGDTGIRVESVVVGDTAIREPIPALLAAVKEAAVNAGRHSGAATVSLYVEVEPRAITAFVRDTGRGFVRETIDPERRGIRESIEGRMGRYRGTATINTTPGEGTEVELRLPLDSVLDRS